MRIAPSLAVVVICACGSSTSPPTPKQTAQQTPPAGSSGSGASSGSAGSSAAPADPWHSDSNGARDLRDKVVALDGHVTVLPKQGRFDNYHDVMAKLEKLPDVVAAEPFIYIEVMVARPQQVELQAAFKGVDPQRVASALGIGSHMVAGTLDALAAREPSILLGAELAEALHVKVGDTVTAHTPAFDATPAGSAHSFRIGGIFKLGFVPLDERTALIPLSSAQELVGHGDTAMGIELKLTSAERAEPVARTVEAELGTRYVALDWYKRNQQTFTTLFGNKRP